jgi:hypothetical protein
MLFCCLFSNDHSKSESDQYSSPEANLTDSDKPVAEMTKMAEKEGALDQQVTKKNKAHAWSQSYDLSLQRQCYKKFPTLAL